MGCDIHLYSETRKDGVWVCDQADTLTRQKFGSNEPLYTYDMDEVPQNRDYGLFGTLAARVRREYEYSFEPRGLPQDVSEEIQLLTDDWAMDAHTHSHLLLSELNHLASQLLISSEHPEDEQNLASLRRLINEFPGADPENTRIVFWFDN